MSFWQALVFALVFFGVWSLRDAPFKTPSTERTLLALIGAVFIILAWALAFVGR